MSKIEIIVFAITVAVIVGAAGFAVSTVSLGLF